MGDLFDKAKRALRRLYKQDLDIKVTPKPQRNRLAPGYKAARVRARKRNETFNELDAIDDSDMGLVILYLPCYCDPNSPCKLDCEC